MKACEIPPPGWPGTVGIFVKRLKFRCLAPFVMTKPAMKKSGSKAASPIVHNTTVNTLFKTRARESRRREAGDKVSEPTLMLMLRRKQCEPAGCSYALRLAPEQRIG